MQFILLGVILAMIKIFTRRIIAANIIHISFVEYGAQKSFVYVWCSVEGLQNHIGPRMTPFNDQDHAVHQMSDSPDIDDDVIEACTELLEQFFGRLGSK